MTSFRSWLDDRYTFLAADFRYRLNIYVKTAHEYAEGNVWEQKHTDIIIQLINKEAPGELGKYPGMVTDEDKAWYQTCVKPDYNAMRMDAIKNLPSVVCEIPGTET